MLDGAHGPPNGLSGKNRRITAFLLDFASKLSKKSGSRKRPRAVGRKNLTLMDLNWSTRNLGVTC